MRRPLTWFLLAAVLLVPALAFADDGSFASYEQRGWGWMFLASFGSGFVTSLTPCVYPMIPITLAIFGARGDNVSKRRAMALATAYVGGMGLTYSLLGVGSALIGRAASFGSQLHNPWVVFPLIALFLVLAASMFGAFDLNLPASWQTKLNTIGGKGFAGAFAMGTVGGLIAAPCTGPFLASLLAYVSTTASVPGGAALMFTYAIGMGVLFWVLAATARALPKSGRWMESVKSGGGIALMFAAIYYSKPFLPWLHHIASAAVWYLVVAIAVAVGGIALGALQLSFHGAWRERLRKGLAVAMVLAGALGIWTWWLTPKHRLPWLHDEAAALARARAEHKGVILDFAASWCVPCQELELTFGDDDVYAEIMARFVPLQLTDNQLSESELDEARARYGVETWPGAVFLGVDGAKPAPLARVDKLIRDPDDMLELISKARRQLSAAPSAAAAATQR
jgi:thiol:disulfide interchange protein DsbD